MEGPEDNAGVWSHSKKHRVESPAPSCMSTSNRAMDPPWNFETEDLFPDIRIEQERVESPAPSCMSMNSNRSMDPPWSFKTEDLFPDVRIKPERVESPAPSCLSVKSDWSMHPPENFNGRVSTPDIRFKQEGMESPAPSCLSVKSDWSMHPPENFNGRVSTPDIRFKQEGMESPAPSCLSVKSDWSMHPPENFKRESQTPDLSEFSSSLLREDHFRCSVCSEVLRDPVSIPCGHSYCRQCISTYWSQPDHAGNYVCPQCSKRSTTRPVLSTNAALARVLQAFRQAGFSPALPALAHIGPGDVACDICSGHKLRAVKTCLTCRASYCESHVRQHYTVPALQRHTLAQVTGDKGCTQQQDNAAGIKCFKEDKNDLKIEEEEDKDLRKRKRENLVEDDTNEINNLKKKISELEQNITSLKNCSKDVEQENSELKDCLKDLDQENLELKNMSKDLESQNSELKNISRDLEQENSELKNSLKLKEQENSESRTTIEDLLKNLSKDLEQRVSETLTAQLTMTMMGCDEVPALGRSIHPGMLYDCRSDSFRTDYLWSCDAVMTGKTSLDHNYTETKVIETDSLEERFKALGMNKPIRASFLSGLVKVEGAAEYLNHPLEETNFNLSLQRRENMALLSKTAARAEPSKAANLQGDGKQAKEKYTTLKYKRTTRVEQLSPSLLKKVTRPESEVIQQQTATHVVIAVEYGTQAFLVFKSDWFWNRNEVISIVKKMIPLRDGEGRGKNLTDYEDCFPSYLSCTYYGDHKAKRDAIGSIEITQVLRSLSKMPKAVPLTIWICPLKKLDHGAAWVREISEDLQDEVQAILKQCRRAEERCERVLKTWGDKENDERIATAMKRTGSSELTRKKQMERVKSTNAQLKEWKDRVSRVLVSVRSGKKKDKELRFDLDRLLAVIRSAEQVDYGSVCQVFVSHLSRNIEKTSCF